MLLPGTAQTVRLYLIGDRRSYVAFALLFCRLYTASFSFIDINFAISGR